MARKSAGPRYYASKHGWFANLNGDRVRLTTGPKEKTKDRAFELYKAETTARGVQVEGDRGTLYPILVAYLRHCENRVQLGDMSASTLAIARHTLGEANKALGRCVVRDLRPKHVEDWLARMATPHRSEKQNRTLGWGSGTLKLGRNNLRSALIWAKDEAGLITSHPFDRLGGKVRRPKRERRRPASSRVAVTDHEHRLMLEQAERRSHPDFAYLLQFLYATGARPAEMYLARADEWDEGRKAFVIKATPENHGRFKLAHLGVDRVIYVPTQLVPLARGLMTKYPDGPIFRAESGQPYTRKDLVGRFKSTRETANRASAKRGTPGIRKEVTAYAWRHAYVTRWLKAGKSSMKLCELLDTSEKMLREHYSHLFEDTVALRESLDEFTAGAGESQRQAGSVA